ncbi:thiamine pyrophosphate-binding protein [Terriglobus albidus]|uniref:thiamine pyrophosphate-binding protein n=1 Tax=Terriglobus albidus TaxID=1592106 RepID=UPI0021E0D25D|nr:thiamine pyrophosphate-binding protein [Terriglobus albidus]
MIKLSDYIMQFLVDRGVHRIFMLTGGGCMHLVDSVGRQAGLEYVCCLHEQGVAFAAQAHAEYTGTLSAALVTTGPGGTNAITGLAAAWLDSTPCIFLSGQVKRADLLTQYGVRSLGPQELDIISVVKPLTKYAKTIVEPNDIRYELERAVHEARTGRRGPVWLDIPLDVQAQMVDESSLRAYLPESTSAADNLLKQQVSDAISLLRQAERPVLFLGNGARQAYNDGLVTELIDRLNIPVLLTWKAMDMLPDDAAQFAGRPGSVASRWSNFTQQNADFILVLGARLDRPQVAFSHEKFARAAKKVIVDIDPAELAKLNMPIDVPVAADAAQFLRELLSQLKAVQLPDTSSWMAKTKDWREKYPDILPEYWQAKDVVDLYVLVDVLSDLCTPDDVLAPGSSGACSDVFLQSFRLKKGQRVVNSPTLGAMGTGLPGSIGSCLASGGRRTIVINGDGGFQLNIQELETVRRLNLPIKFFVLCNGTYASIMGMQTRHFQGRMVGSDPESHLTLPDVRNVAQAYGIATDEIADHEGIREKIQAMLDRPGPLVCAVTVSSEQVVQPRATSATRADGTIVSLPMEDMEPRLPREVFRAEMIVAPVEV